MELFQDFHNGNLPLYSLNFGTIILLSAFEELSDLKINFHKSEVFCFREAKDYESQYEQLFGCKKGSFPFKYLGISMHYRKLNNKD
jgi:hypothetical protein